MRVQWHYITAFHYANYIALRHNCNYHFVALRDTTLQLRAFALQFTTLYHARVRNTTVHYTIRYNNCTTLQLQLQLQLRYTN